jgi:sugar phosphate isomerase/epimerase
MAAGLPGSDRTFQIDRIAGKEGDLWVYFRDDDGNVTDAQLESLVRGVLSYAVSKGVRVALYPHYNNIIPTAEDAIAFVDMIDHPSLCPLCNWVKSAGNSGFWI